MKRMAIIIIVLVVSPVAVADDAELARLRAENRMLKSTIERLRERVGELEKRLEAAQTGEQTTQPASTGESTSRPQDAAQWPDKLTYRGVEVSRKWVEKMYDQYRHQYHVGEDGELVDLGGYYKRTGQPLRKNNTYALGEFVRCDIRDEYTIERRIANGDVIVAAGAQPSGPRKPQRYPIHISGLSTADKKHGDLPPRIYTGLTVVRPYGNKVVEMRHWHYRLLIYQGQYKYVRPENRETVEMPSFRTVQHPSPAEFAAWLANGGVLHEWEFVQRGRALEAKASEVPAPQDGAEARSSQSD